jgi:DNA polymerase I-like protein with 3'-5' exonuclease and polymerase domains
MATEVLFPQRFVPLKGSIVAKSVNPQTGQPYTDRTIFYQTDQPTLQQLKARSNEAKEILTLLSKLALQSKVGEMASSIIKKMTAMNWADDYIHGQFNQNVVVTGRLSSSGPNLQNQPPEIDKLLVSRYDC